jgi:hypothetical protein
MSVQPGVVTEWIAIRELRGALSLFRSIRQMVSHLATATH